MSVFPGMEMDMWRWMDGWLDGWSGVNDKTNSRRLQLTHLPVTISSINTDRRTISVMIEIDTRYSVIAMTVRLARYFTRFAV